MTAEKIGRRRRRRGDNGAIPRRCRARVRGGPVRHRRGSLSGGNFLDAIHHHALARLEALVDQPRPALPGRRDHIPRRHLVAVAQHVDKRSAQAPLDGALGHEDRTRPLEAHQPYPHELARQQYVLRIPELRAEREGPGHRLQGKVDEIEEAGAGKDAAVGERHLHGEHAGRHEQPVRRDVPPPAQHLLVGRAEVHVDGIDLLHRREQVARARHSGAQVQQRPAGAAGNLRADEGVIVLLLRAIHCRLRRLDRGARLIEGRLGVIYVLLGHGARAKQRLEAHQVALGVRESGSGVRELRLGAPVGRLVRRGVDLEEQGALRDVRAFAVGTRDDDPGDLGAHLDATRRRGLSHELVARRDRLRGDGQHRDLRRRRGGGGGPLTRPTTQQQPPTADCPYRCSEGTSRAHDRIRCHGPYPVCRRGQSSRMKPRCSAVVTAPVRSSASSFSRIFLRCTLTVPSVRPMRAATCTLLSPCATS